MNKRSQSARSPVAGEDVEMITLSIAAEDKATLGKIANEKRVSIAWVIRDAITKYSRKSRKNQMRDPADVLPRIKSFLHVHLYPS